MRQGLLFILALINITSAQAQQFFDLFQLAQKNQKVLISMVVKAGNTCNGLIFYRSIDSLNFEPIGDIGGVCGDLSSPVAYSFLDNQPPLNHTLYYKVEIPGYGFSNVLSIFISEATLGSFLVSPNPVVNHQTNLLFTGTDLPKLKGEIYNQLGQLITQFSILEAKQALEVADLPSGVYYFVIYTADNQFLEIIKMIK